MEAGARQIRAYLERKKVPLQEIALDPVRWENPKAHGDSILYLQLDADDLRAIGESVYASYRAFLADDPAYFDSEMMEDVPRPKDESLFVTKPLLLKRYLKQGSFWRNATIRAITHRMDPWHEGQRRYLIEELRDVKIDKGRTIVLLEVAQAVPTGGRMRTF